MTKQTIKVLVGFTLPTYKWPDKVARAIERLINLNVSSKPFAFVAYQRYGSDHIRPQTLNDGAADQFRRILRDFDDIAKAALALDHCHNGSIIVRANYRVAYPMAHLLSNFDMRRQITTGAPKRHLVPPVPPWLTAVFCL